MTDDEIEIQDRSLLKQAIYKKDQYAQKYIYVKYKEAVRQFIKKNNRSVDDHTHEVFLNICEGKCQYSGNTDVKGYLCGIAKNVVRHHIRKEKRQDYANIVYQNNNSIMSNHQTSIANKSKKNRGDKFQEILHQAIAKLPSKSREAVELVLIHKIKPHQAAKQLTTSPVVFRNRLHRGLKELRKKIPRRLFFRR